MNELLQSLLGMFGGGQPRPTGLFTNDPMMQQLLQIERATGGGGFLDALSQQLQQQGRGVELTQQKRGVQRVAPTQLGETTGFFGLPPGLSTGPRQAGVFPEASTGSEDVRRTLQGRNPFVQSLLDTMKHELGHVAEQITPGAGFKSPERVAERFGGEQKPLTAGERGRLEATTRQLRPNTPLQQAAQELGITLE